MANMLLKCENDPSSEEANLEDAKIHRCDIKIKNLPKSLDYSHLSEDSPHKVKQVVKRFDIRIKKLAKTEEVINATKLYTGETIATKSDKIDNDSFVENNSRIPGLSEVSVQSETKICNGQEKLPSSDKVSTGANGNNSEEYNGVKSSQPYTNGQSRSSGRESGQSISRESRKSAGRESRQSSIAGRTSRLSVTSSMSDITSGTGGTEDSSGVEVIGYGRKTENGYEFEEEEEEDSSDSEEDSLEDGEIRMPSSAHLIGRFDLNKEESEEEDNSIANHKRKLMEIFLEDSDSETKSNKKDMVNEDIVCLSDDSDHVSKIVPIGPPTKKKKNEAWVFNKSKSVDVTLDDSASGKSSSFSNYFDMSSRRSSVSAEDSDPEGSWKLDPGSGDWKLEGSINNYKLKKFSINVKEEHLYNTRAKDCYLRFRNIRKTLAMQDRAFNDPIIVANRPGDEEGFGGLPCPFNCGAEFHLKDQVYFHDHVNGKCPISKLQQVVAPEKTTQCGVCRSQIPKSQLEDHFDNFHRPHPCTICQCKWQTEVELQEHILEDHASHFMAEIPPIVKKQLVTVWQTEHQKPGDLIPSSQVYARGAGGQLTPVQAQQGQVFQRGSQGEVIPMQLKPPGQIVGGGVSGAFTPVLQQPGQVLNIVQQQTGQQIFQVQRPPGGHVFQKGADGILRKVEMPMKQIFQRLPNGELRQVMRVQTMTQQVFQRAPVSLPNQPVPMHVMPTQMGNLVNRPQFAQVQPSQAATQTVYRRAPNGSLIAMLRPAGNPALLLPRAPILQSSIIRPNTSTPGNIWTPPVAQNIINQASTSDQGEQSYRIPVSQLPENIRQQIARSGNENQNVVVMRSLPTEFSSMGQQPLSFVQGPVTPAEFSDPPQMQILPAGAKVVSLAQRSSPTELNNPAASSHFAPIHPANIQQGRISVLKRLSPVVPTDGISTSPAPEPSILQSQLSRTYGKEATSSQVKIPPQYSYSRPAGDVVKIPPQYARPIAQNPHTKAPHTYSQAIGAGIKMANLSSLLNNPHVDEDGAPVSQFDNDGAPWRSNNTLPTNIMSQPVNTPQLHSKDGGIGVEDNLEDFSDPAVDPLEDPLSLCEAGDLQGGAGDLEEDEEGEGGMDIMDFCDTVLNESDKRVFF